MKRLLPATLVALLTTACIFSSSPSPTPAPDCPTAAPTANGAQEALTDVDRAVVTTNKGAFTMTLDPSSAPIATANFVLLARCGFYDRISFHRVIAGFVAQAGDPQTKGNTGDFEGLGAGDPGYRFEVEFPPQDLRYATYDVAMANGVQFDRATLEVTGNTASTGSQFFIALAELPLPPFYSIIGRVTEGTDVVDAIGAVPVNGQRGLPLDPVIIESIAIGAAIASPSPGT
ncbi:MAG: peptidylprolyl isomerase [Chloroflexota bacterium]